MFQQRLGLLVHLLYLRLTCGDGVLLGLDGLAHAFEFIAGALVLALLLVELEFALL